MPRGLRPPRPRLSVAIPAAILVAAAAFGGTFTYASHAPDPTGSSVAPAASPTVTIAPTPTPAPPTPAPTPVQSTAAPSALPASSGPTHQVALVPIVNFWSTERSTSRAELAWLVWGASVYGDPNRIVAVETEDISALGQALSVTPRVEAMSAADVRARVKATPGALGIVSADEVTVEVRALAVDGVSLFGIDRASLSDWPLLAEEPGAASEPVSAPIWTMAAGGDVMLDKAVYAQSIRHGLSVDYAWNGGTATIDGRRCCGWGGKPLAVGHRTGDAGAVAHLFRTADLAVVNLESPEPDRFRYHASGFVFTGDPQLLAGLKDAGIDLAGLANNHLGNGGARGVTDTIRHLDNLGVAHAGAGANQSDARNAAWLYASGWSVAVLAYCEIDPLAYWAAPGRPGSAAYSIGAITRDIKAARRAGAHMVIVMPHWGLEYTDSVLAVQRSDARAMIAAGANLILGSHSHWVGPFEQIAPGHFVFYSLGNLVFDWTHDERTQEGVVADLTFVGNRLVQIDLHPTLIIDGQPNLLDPAGDGQAVLGPVYRSSEPMLRW